MRAQHARAEGMDRRDPGPLGRACGLVIARFTQPHADALAELGCGLFGERDRQDLADADSVLMDGASEPLDQHRCLAATGAGVEQQLALTALDRKRLLRRELHRRQLPAQQIPG